MWRSITICFAMLASLSTANSATILSTLLPKSDVYVIAINGPILPQDYEKFRQIAVMHSKAVISFNSDGGNLIAGIQIGRLIRLRNFATLVADGERCASACALAWLGGTIRFMGARALVGFHAAYNATSGQETGVGNAVVGVYLNEIGLSYKAAIYITSAAPSAITWLTVADARNLGIEVSVLGATQTSSPADTTPGASSAPPAVASSPLRLQPSTAPNLGLAGSLRERSKRFIADVYRLTSQSTTSAGVLRELYDTNVNYYGKEMSNDDVIDQISRFLSRWPIRTYFAVPGTLMIQCDVTAMTCEADGLVTFDARNIDRNQRSYGKAKFSYTLRFTSSTEIWPKIVSESGSVVERHKGKLF